MTDRAGRGFLRTICISSLCAFFLVLALTSSTAAFAVTSTGGARLVETPTIKRVVCSTQCGKKRRIQNGSTIKIAGKDFASAQQVIFLGGPGKSDDVTAAIAVTGLRAIKVKVPDDAISGRLTIAVEGGVQSKPSRSFSIASPPPIIGTPELQPVGGPADSGAPHLETGTSTPRVVFLGSIKLVRFSFRVSGAPAADAKVELVHTTDGVVVNTWTPAVVPDQIISVDWDGLINGVPQPNGRYSFRLTVAGADGITAQSAADADPQRDAFDLYDHMFPVRGVHDFGQSGARFGAGRTGHVHQGQDVMAACGTRLVAARGGIVRFNQYHSAAGYYIVIDGDNSDIDNTYMHLRTRSPFKAGDHVYTGQTIGQVGDTGDARGCHLHFEEWTAPGWYKGGKPFDPLPDLLAWDVFS